jgi:hypothetical protein
MAVLGRLLERLIDAGFSEDFVRASFPAWWTSEEETSTSAQTLITLLLARRLSLDPESLLDDNVPIGFLHTGPTKFKQLRLGPGLRRDALTAYCQGVARIVFAALSGAEPTAIFPTAADLRQSIFQSGRDHVGFGDVLALCWSLGIPVLHLRLFPARTKGVTAVAVRLADRHAILVARESGIAAQYMFHVAHELGHIGLGHLKDATTIIDADPNDPENSGTALETDTEEEAADAFAQELLTGNRKFHVTRSTLEPSSSNLGTPRELADRALQAGQDMSVDPGHIVMCFGETTGEWALAQAAAKLIPDQDERPGTLVNKVFWDQLAMARDDQSTAFLRAVAPI